VRLFYFSAEPYDTFIDFLEADGLLKGRVRGRVERRGELKE
jgi:hypothetical protein